MRVIAMDKIASYPYFYVKDLAPFVTIGQISSFFFFLFFAITPILGRQMRLLISALPYPERGKQFFFHLSSLVLYVAAKKAVDGSISVGGFLATALRVIEVKVTWEIKESVAVAGKKTAIVQGHFLSLTNLDTGLGNSTLFHWLQDKRIREYRDDPLVVSKNLLISGILLSQIGIDPALGYLFIFLEGSPREGHYFFREEPYFYQLEKHLISWQKSNPLSRGIACAFRGIASNIGNKSYKGILDTPDARKALGDEWFLIQTRPICKLDVAISYQNKRKKSSFKALGLEEKEDERYPFTERAANIKQLSSLKLQKVLFSFSDIDGCVQNGMIPFLMFSFMLKEQENVQILRGLKILFCLGLKIITDELKEIEMIDQIEQMIAQDHV
ncbi:hypothetical protein ACJX0J_042309, partial [Zea mays]